MKNVRPTIIGFLLGLCVMGSFVFGAGVERFKGLGILDKLFNSSSAIISPTGEKMVEVKGEESIVTQVVSRASGGVVTVSISKTNLVADPMSMFNGFGFNLGPASPPKEQKIEQDIGTGFVIRKDGLIVTNKHVVADTQAKYKVILSKDGKDEVLEVKNIYRDPLTDLAILKVDKTDLVPLELGDSDKIKVGQLAIAIGTALGEFRSTVTTGVISGVGRGITAGSPFEGSEKLENVIQTDAAINPGNSGGPLLNSAGQVVGVNVAVSQSGQNIGFALPINLVKESINNFNTTGQFERPFLGVAYQPISKRTALLNNVPQGDYVQEVVEDSPAKKAGIEAGDILTEIDGIRLDDETTKSLASIINKKKIGESVKVKLFRNDKEINLDIVLDKAK